MPIITSNNVIKSAPAKPSKAKEGGLESMHSERRKQRMVQQSPAQPVKKQQETVQNDSNLIKPKYVEDKSVFYKPSDYLKDLLGEGN